MLVKSYKLGYNSTVKRPIEIAAPYIPEGPERLSPETFERIGIHTLNRAKSLHDRLGPRGARPLNQYNQYGETPILADRAVEKLIIWDLAASGIRFHGKSEEHGDVYTYDGEVHSEPSTDPTKQPEAFFNLDGEDGSKAAGAYLEGSRDRLHTRFATMLSLAPTPEPRLRDFTFAGTYEHFYESDYVHKKREMLDDESFKQVRNDRPEAVGRLVFATKGRGAFVRTPFEFRRLQAPQIQDIELGEETPVHYLEYDYFGEIEADNFESFLNRRRIPAAKTLSTGSHFIDLLAGTEMPLYAISQPDRERRFHEVSDARLIQPIIAVAEPERKGQEELAVNFLLVSEWGGVIRTLEEGQPVDVGEMPFIPMAEKWRTQQRPNRQPVVAAANANIADTLLRASVAS